MPVTVVLEREDVDKQFEVQHLRLCDHLNLVIHVQPCHFIHHILYVAYVIIYVPLIERGDLET